MEIEEITVTGLVSGIAVMLVANFVVWSQVAFRLFSN